MGKIVLMESHPLLRLGLWQIVKKLGEPWEIVELDYDALAKGESPAIGVDLLIYGVSSGAGSCRPTGSSRQVRTASRTKSASPKERSYCN